MYVVDSENNRVQVFDSERPLPRQVGPARDRRSASSPSRRAIAVDCDGDVYVADTNNNRVERFDPCRRARGWLLAPGAWPPPLDVAPVLRVQPAAQRAACSRGARSR